MLPLHPAIATPISGKVRVGGLMAVGDFVWCDLSTLRPETTRPFYRDLFGWDYSVNQLPDGSDYAVAESSAGEAAGIFEMPRKFQEMKLPSFWMGYIEVGDADAAVASALENGGKVELGPVPFQDGARIALIRDPLGAGFTVIENSGLPVRSDNALEGSMIWNALYVSDAARVISFYEHLFGWRFKPLIGSWTNLQPLSDPEFQWPSCCRSCASPGSDPRLFRVLGHTFFCCRQRSRQKRPSRPRAERFFTRTMMRS
jgi:predicted enzyme related to lactoylglutathione lyase